MKLYDELVWRGLIESITDEEVIEKINNGGLTFYIGTDPTGDSLHIGHYSTFSMAFRLKKGGHNPILLVGGGTGAIGDPKPSAERPMITLEQLDYNYKRLRKQVEEIFGFEVVNNFDWISKINTIDFLRDYGKYFNINYMLDKETVKSRLESGITYTEFSYMILQALDFLHLYEEKNCTLQIGGSDQWGNILAGADLSRKIGFSEGKKIDPLFGWTCPLLIKADGEKMGKTASGTLWVSRDKTTPFDFFQAWINSFDEDVERSLSFFTRMEISDIKELCKKDIREAKKLLAFEVTKLVHGEEEALKAQKTAEELFSNKGVSENMPSTELSKDLLNINIIDLLVASKLVSSKSEARRLIEQNGISLNQEKISSVDQIITDKDLNDNALIIQKGKKVFLKVIFK